MRYPIIKNIILIVFISLCVLTVTTCILIAYDMHLHKKYSKTEDYNYRGYRGVVLGKKEPNEIRIGIFGGSRAMGYSVHYSKSIASFLETLIEKKNFGKKYTVINLAGGQEASCAHFRATYSVFSYLDIDVLVFYFGSNPIGIDKDPARIDFIQNLYSERIKNWVLRDFRYYFIFPTMLQEKYYRSRYHDIGTGYKKDKIFKGIYSLLNRLRETVSKREKDKKSLSEFVRELTSRDKIFIFALAPSEINGDPEYWQKLNTYFKKNYSDNPRVIIADLKGAFTKERAVMYFTDDYHYSEIGDRAIAEKLFNYIPFDVLENKKPLKNL